MVDATNIPDMGDVITINFKPQSGREQAGKRPAVVLSPLRYNQKVGLVIICPITSHSKGYGFEVKIPEGQDVQGVILADHVKSMDWKSRGIKRIGKIPEETLKDTLNKLDTLIRDP